MDCLETQKMYLCHLGCALVANIVTGICCSCCSCCWLLAFTIACCRSDLFFSFNWCSTWLSLVWLWSSQGLMLCSNHSVFHCQHTPFLFLQEVMISVQTSSVYGVHCMTWLHYGALKQNKLFFLHILRQVESVIYWMTDMSQFWLQMLRFILQCSFDSCKLEPISYLYFGLIHHKLKLYFLMEFCDW